MERRARFTPALIATWIVAFGFVSVAGTALAANCPSVKSGFGGDINATYANDYGGNGDSGGAGPGGGDSGGDAGAGAGEGKVLGAQMTVMRLADGALLGSAVTDNVNGLVSVQVCPGDLPVLLTLTGQAGASYFDEAANRLIPFGADRTLHALIDAFNENVAVSALTEAAYRYALNNYKSDPNAIRAGAIPLQTTGSVVGLTLEQVRKANDTVLAEINRLQTANMKLVSIKSLPTPIDTSSAGTALPDNRYGVAAAVLGGLASMGAQFTRSQNPAVDIGEQIARDLTDGTLNGFGLDGFPAAGPGVPVAYDLVRLPVATSVGANDVSGRYGAATTLLRATPIVEKTFAGATFADGGPCNAGGESATLNRDGSVTRDLKSCGGVTETQVNFATQVKLVEGSDTGTPPRTFFVKADGTVWGWGDTLCGILGNGKTDLEYQSTPVQIAGISGVTAIATGAWFTIARDDTGAVYSWGINYQGELGRGTKPSGAVRCENAHTTDPRLFGFADAVTTPARIDTLSNVVSVAVDGHEAVALDKDGRLFEWGLIPKDWNFSVPQSGYHGDYEEVYAPRLVNGLPQLVGAAASYFMKMGLAIDGTLWGWGPNIVGNFGDGTAVKHLTPTQVPGISGVVEIAASITSPFVALLKDGTIRYWGGCCLNANGTITPNVQKIPTFPPLGGTRFYSPTTGFFSGTLPAIRHVKGNGGQVLLYGADGSLLQFPKSQQDNAFVVLSGPVPNYEGQWWNAPANSEAGWGINLAHQGDVIFATWFTYKADGRAWWLSMTADKTADKTYTGTLYETRGPAFNAVPFNPALVTPIAVGSGTLSFHDNDNGVFSYTVNGVSQVKSITRQLFSMPPTCTFGIQSDPFATRDYLSATRNYQDLWWAKGGAESGWGVNLTHQGDIIFATWFTYDADGTPLWLSATANKSGDAIYSGKLYRTSGPAFNTLPFNPSAVTATGVGQATFKFTDGATGTFSYDVNGIVQTKAITRQVLRAPGTVCRESNQ